MSRTAWGGDQSFRGFLGQPLKFFKTNFNFKGNTCTWVLKRKLYKKKGTTEDETVGWHHRLDGLESGWTPADGDEQGGLACCDSWGHKESDTTERLNWTELNWMLWNLADNHAGYSLTFEFQINKKYIFSISISQLDFPGGASGKEPTGQCRRHKRRGFDPWVRKIPWKRAWKPTPVALPGESHGQRSMWSFSSRGRREVDGTEAT